MEEHGPGTQKDSAIDRGAPLPTSESRPRVLLLGLDSSARSHHDVTAEESLDELGLLVDTWGGEVAARLLQTRPKPDPSWYVGRGKLAEAVELARASGANTLATDSELTPGQLRRIEKEVGEAGLDLRVIDRTQVILEIFARRAHSREGRLEVDLAQAIYALPRLTGKGLILSRLGGGIGTRGPGETKLEMDRRHLRQRINNLKEEIAGVGRQREVQSRTRREGAAPLAALVGYTNAGKSTLFNRLTGADVLVEDKLFATLDPVVRRLDLPNGQKVLISDTVGFIRKLPHNLVASFRATLEEVRSATVLIHVIDVSDPSWAEYAAAANSVLVEIEATSAPVIYALNKTDRLAGGRAAALADPRAQERARQSRVVALSAVTGDGLDELQAALSAELAGRRQVFTFKVPYAQASLISELHEKGRVLSEVYEADGVAMRVEMEISAGRRVEAALGQRDREQPQ